MWWMYFVIPSATLLERFRERAFGWGYGHLVLLMSVAATGTGLRVAARSLGGEARIGEVAVVAATAVPFGAFVLSIYAIYSAITRTIDPFHLWLVGGAAAVIAVSVVAAAASAPLAGCLLVLVVAPAVTVVGYELVGHRRGDGSGEPG